MEDIKKKLDDIRVEYIEDVETQEVVYELIKVNRLLIAKLEQIPYWVFENKCCPPGDSCCNCD